MTCSRCGHTEPNITCYVCWREPDEGEDCFAKAKSFSLEDEGFLYLPQFPASPSDPSTGHGQPSMSGGLAGPSHAQKTTRP